MATDLTDLLLHRWDLAAAEGVLRTNVDDTLRRRVPGELGLVVQFNPNHLKNKRPVDKQLLNATKMAPVKPAASAFNFTKAKRSEFLCGLRFVMDDDKSLPSVQVVDAADDARHFILVNVAPLVPGHFLFVPNLNDVKQQKLEKHFLEYALSLSQRINREDFTLGVLGFNSSGAWSSVNHFHLQGYFFPRVENAATSRSFPVVAQPRKELFRVGGVAVKSLPSWKTTCYVVEPENSKSNAMDAVDVAWQLLEILQAKGIPHNLLIVGTAVFIFPRQQQCENGVGLFPGADAENGETRVYTGRFRVAVAELSGLVVAGDEVAFEHLAEEIFSHVLQHEVSLSADDEEAILADWKANLGVIHAAE